MECDSLRVILIENHHKLYNQLLFKKFDNYLIQVLSDFCVF